MGNKQKFIGKQRQRRQRHVRARVRGNQEKPRLSIFRSNRHLCCQVIDDSKGCTLAAASSLEAAKSVQPKTSVSAVVGKLVAERALAQGITQVVFDRGGGESICFCP